MIPMCGLGRHTARNVKLITSRPAEGLVNSNFVRTRFGRAITARMLYLHRTLYSLHCMKTHLTCSARSDEHVPRVSLRAE